MFSIENDSGQSFGFLNTHGDTIIEAGKYAFSFSDTINPIGMVAMKGTGKIICIDNKGAELYEVFNYDNGPDYIKNGLFRIIVEDKIGYADSLGKIIITPKYTCAHAFEGDQAKVSESCETVVDGEHFTWESEAWYFIDKKGQKVEL
jgi:hypothetical protein